MRILHVIPSFGSGGAERVVLNYMIDWARFEDDEVAALALHSSKNSIFDQEIETRGLPVVYANCVPGKKGQIVAAIRRRIREFKPDVVHSHQRVLPFVYLAALGSKAKIAHTIHTDPEVHTAGKMKAFDAWCARRSKVTPICLNRELAERADRLYGVSKCEFLYNGVDLKRYRTLSRAEIEAKRVEIGAAADDFIVGHVGRFVAIKNQPLLVKALARLLERRPNARLVLIGEGPEMDATKALAAELGVAERVSFLGARTDVPELTQTFDVFALPSSVEGLGIVLIEAQAAGLPCVVSEAIPEEAIVSKRVIRAKLTDSPDVWANAFEENRETRESCNDIALFDRPVVVDKLRGIYRSLVEGKR